MAYDNMIVVDQEFEKGASQLSAYFTLLENTLVQYKSILINISTGAISSGSRPRKAGQPDRSHPGQQHHYGRQGQRKAGERGRHPGKDDYAGE